MDTQYNFRNYYMTDKYKGFYKCSKPRNGFSRLTRLAFTNGKKKIFTTGMYLEDATAKAFIAIDNYHEQNKNTNGITKKHLPNRVFIGVN